VTLATSAIFQSLTLWLIIISMLRRLFSSIGLHSGVAFVTRLYWHSGARVEENTLVTHLFCLAHLYNRAIYLRVACTRAVLHCWWHNAAVLRIHKINAKRVQVQQQGRHSSRSPIRSANDNLPLYASALSQCGASSRAVAMVCHRGNNP
jgi:hypothetical protein